MTLHVDDSFFPFFYKIYVMNDKGSMSIADS